MVIEMNVTRFSNEDVISTSTPSSYSMTGFGDSIKGNLVINGAPYVSGTAMDDYIFSKSETGFQKDKTLAEMVAQGDTKNDNPNFANMNGTWYIVNGFFTRNGQ